MDIATTLSIKVNIKVSQLPGAVKYTDSISAEK